MKKTPLFSCLAFEGSRATAGPPVIHKPLIAAAMAFAHFDAFPTGTTTKK